MTDALLRIAGLDRHEVIHQFRSQIIAYLFLAA